MWLCIISLVRKLFQDAEYFVILSGGKEDTKLFIFSCSLLQTMKSTNIRQGYIFVKLGLFQYFCKEMLFYNGSLFIFSWLYSVILACIPPYWRVFHPIWVYSVQLKCILSYLSIFRPIEVYSIRYLRIYCPIGVYSVL